MQVGSLVVVKPIYRNRDNAIKWLPVDDESTIYVIRGIHQGISRDGIGTITTGVHFEEGVIGYNDNGTEICLVIDLVREVQAPGEISAQQIVEESIYETV